MKSHISTGIVLMLAGEAFLGSCNRSGHTQVAENPNVVFILADDMGWTQSGIYGSAYYRTPNIDRLASEGLRFTDAYAAAAVCSPTRASIMTGKYPARLHLTDFIKGNPRTNYPLLQPEWQTYLPLEEYTLGELFHDAGYRTAIFGKWHLSKDKQPPVSLPWNPDKQGFDEYMVTYKPDRNTDPENDPHNSDSIMNRSLQFLKENKAERFFLFVSFNAIHDPIMEKADSINIREQRPGSGLPENSPVIAAMMERMDWNIGRLLDYLDKSKLKKNTLVVFFSDNGGKASHASQAPLRKGKGWLYEGGIKEPLIIRWPGVVKENSVSNALVSSIDFMPTFCRLLKVPVPENVDGISILEHIKDGSPLPERALFWHYPHYHYGTKMVPAGAMRRERWKLVEWYEKSLTGDQQPYELYNLENDQGENVDLADSLPDVTMEMAGELKQWREDVGGQMPTVNPDYEKK